MPKEQLVFQAIPAFVGLADDVCACPWIDLLRSKSPNDHAPILSDREVISLAGNAFHAGLMGTFFLYNLGSLVPVETISKSLGGFHRAHTGLLINDDDDAKSETAETD